MKKHFKKMFHTNKTEHPDIYSKTQILFFSGTDTNSSIPHHERVVSFVY